MILERIGVVLLVALFVVFEAAVVATMKDNSKKMIRPQHYFHKWLLIWAAVNTILIVVGYYLATGTLLGVTL